MTMDTTNNRRYAWRIAIVLAVICFVVAGFLCLKSWEDGRGQFPVSGTQDGVITYHGTDYVPNEAIDTFLVMGLDRYGDAASADAHENGVQADFLMLFVFDNETKQCSALHINRDTMAKVNKLSIGGTAVVDTYTKQIALAYNYVVDGSDKVRCRNTKDSVEALLHGVGIDHYLSLTMDAVAAMNDLVDGVEVTVLDDFTGIDDALIQGETVTLKGEQALRYVRTRYGLEDSTNNTRMARQQQYIRALYDKTFARMKDNDEFLVTWVDTMDEYVVYDSSDKKMQKIAEKFAEYEFCGIRELKGETKQGEKFIEFYADEASVWEQVIDLFYLPKTDAEE